MPFREPAQLRSIPHIGKQRGAALLVALILLIVITLVGLAAIGTTILQNKAAANSYDREVAFQSAEAAMRQAQAFITTNAVAYAPTPSPIEDCSTPSTSTTPVNVCLANPFSDSNSTSYIQTVASTKFDAGSLSAGQPQYVIQYLGSFLAPTPAARQIGGGRNYGSVYQGEMADYYRITARSDDPTKAEGRSIVTLQSTFRN
ncbi:MAG: pilus assembly protein [Xanthomonadaceae bacterium]|nr:pilus assembly protein [Xanthomonadaceae bacterium]